MGDKKKKVPYSAKYHLVEQCKAILKLWQNEDSFSCLTRLSSFGRCGLAETVGLGFCVDPDGASSVFVLDLVFVCVFVGVFVVF